MDKQIIQKIIEAGNQAPSGGNSQPWMFEVRGSSVAVIALPEKDHPIYNTRNRGTYVAHGALLENMDSAASHFGYQMQISLFPPTGELALLTFEEKLLPEHRLDFYEAIFKRHSNRKPYAKELLSDSLKKFVFDDVRSFPQCKLLMVEGDTMSLVAAETAFDIVVSLKNKLLHNLLYKEILWRENDQLLKGGLYVRTLEMKPPTSTMLWFLKNWSFAQIMNRTGMFKKIHMQNAKKTSSASLMGAIIVPNDDAAFVHAGRLLENVWLRAISKGLSMSLMTGISFLWQHAHMSLKTDLSMQEITQIDRAYNQLKELFGIKDGIIAVIFRLGKAPPPLAVALKRSPLIKGLP